MRHRLQTDLSGGGTFNTALHDWLGLANGAALRAEVKKAFKSDIPLKERGEWEGFLQAQQAEHTRFTTSMIER